MSRHVRRPRFTTPMTAARNLLALTLGPILRWFRPATRFLIGFFALAVLTTLLLARTRSALTSAEVYLEGDIVRADVIAPADITFEDTRETALRSDAARRDTPPVWNYAPTQIESAFQSFRTSWATLKQQAEARGAANNNASNQNNQHERELVWPGAGADRQSVARAVAAHNFDAATLELLTHMMRDAGGLYVFDERDAEQIRPEMRVVDTRAGVQTTIVAEQSRFVSLDAARESLRSHIAELAGWRPAERELLASAMIPLLKATVAFNPAATE